MRVATSRGPRMACRHRSLLARAAVLGTMGIGADATRPAEAEQPPSRPPEISARIEFQVKAGTLLDALALVERQTGIAFSVLPELLPPGLAVEALAHSGTLADGVDRLTRPLDLHWEVGEFGGIIVLPAKPPVPSWEGWVGEHFEDAGIEILEVHGDYRGLGLQPGDRLVALNGERIVSMRDFDVDLQRHLKEEAPISWNPGDPAPLRPAAPMVFTVLRAGATFEVGLPIVHRQLWGESLGLRRVADAPSFWRRYEKGGHRSPAWDAKFRAVFEEYAKGAVAIAPEALWQRARECRDLGCRDPLLPLLVLERWTTFGEPEWNEFERFFDPRQLRAAYGGQLADARLRVAARFAVQGPPGVRRQALRRVECGWAWKRAGPIDRLVCDLGYAIAVGHFLRGDDEACLRAMDRVQEAFLQNPSVSRFSLVPQALIRQRRYAEAAQAHAAYVPVGIDREEREMYAALLKAAADVLPSRSDLLNDHFDGSVGLLSWRKLALMTSLCRRAGRPDKEWNVFDLERAADLSRAFAAKPFPSRTEMLLFPRFVKENRADQGVVGMVFGVAIRDGHIQPAEYSEYEQYGIDRNLELRRKRFDLYDLPPIPLPGFANDGMDTVRIFKTPEVIAVRCNGARVTTDVSAVDPSKGAATHIAAKAAGHMDAAVFVPTSECHDNDRIRELIDEIIDVRRDMSLPDVSKKLAEAAGLAPPGNFIKEAYLEIPDGAREKIPPPPFPASPAPPLAALTCQAAEERLRRRGPVLWVRPDAANSDAVWCVRPDGTLDVMSRVHYWTDTHRYIPQYAGTDVAVGEPVFTKESVWFPTRRGLFRYDRREEVFIPIPLGGLFHDVPVKGLTMDPAGRLIIEPEGGAAGGAWRLDSDRGTWGPAGDPGRRR